MYVFESSRTGYTSPVYKKFCDMQMCIHRCRAVIFTQKPCARIGAAKRCLVYLPAQVAIPSLFTATLFNKQPDTSGFRGKNRV